MKHFVAFFPSFPCFLTQLKKVENHWAVNIYHKTFLWIKNVSLSSNKICLCRRVERLSLRKFSSRDKKIMVKDVQIINCPCFMLLRPSKAHVTRDSFAHNITNKDKEILQHLTIFSNIFLLINKGKLFQNCVYLALCFDKSLPLPRDIHGPKISFYRNFIAILCAKMSRVTWALSNVSQPVLIRGTLPYFFNNFASLLTAIF